VLGYGGEKTKGKYESLRILPFAIEMTYMHVNPLAIPPLAADNSRNNNQLVLGDKVADASLVSTAVAPGGGKIELQGGCELDDEKKQTEEGPHVEP
jgi:hypothetical protein